MKYLYYTLIPLCCILNIGLYSQQYEPVTIKTPNNTEITADKLVSGDFSSEEKQAIRDAIADYWYGKEVFYQDEATYAYNCHGYAWQVTEGEDEVWINDPDDDEFWNDGSYVEASSETEAEKVSYGDCDTCAYLPLCVYCYENSEVVCSVYVCRLCANLCDHSAVTSVYPGYFKSKWGEWCLILHESDETPYLIQPEAEGGLMYFKRCREVFDEDITSDFTKEDCCEFILQGVTISNNADVVLKTKNYDKYTQIDEFIQINGPFEIQIGSTLEIQ